MNDTEGSRPLTGHNPEVRAKVKQEEEKLIKPGDRTARADTLHATDWKRDRRSEN